MSNLDQIDPKEARESFKHIFRFVKPLFHLITVINENIFTCWSKCSPVHLSFNWSLLNLLTASAEVVFLIFFLLLIFKTLLLMPTICPHRVCPFATDLILRLHAEMVFIIPRGLMPAVSQSFRVLCIVSIVKVFKPFCFD